MFFLIMTNMFSNKKNSLPLNSFLNNMKFFIMKIRNIEWTTFKDPKNTLLCTAPVAKMTSACMASKG